MSRQDIAVAIHNSEQDNKNREHAYELTRQLAFYMIGLELALCGYMLLNADKIGFVFGAPFLFLCSGLAALAGIVWRYAWNEHVHRLAHRMKASNYHLIMLKIMFPVYVVFVLLSLLTFFWAVGGGFSYLNSQRNMHEAAAPAISTPKVPTAPANHQASVQVVFLGTGTPAPNPERQGPANAIVVDGKAYIVDAGTGVVRQTQAASRNGMPGLRPDQLDIAFITHLHSDHTLGLADLILTPWVMHRIAPLELYGPVGTQAMAADLLHAFSQDIHVRQTGGEGANPTGYKVDAHDIQPGVIYQDDRVKVTAFKVEHGTWVEALGYRFDAESKSVVFSGDTRPTESVIQACNGCDVLVHEAYVGDSKDAWMVYMRKFHTSATELGELAARAKPKLLVVTHTGYVDDTTEADMLADIRKAFKGEVKLARDLDVVTP